MNGLEEILKLIQGIKNGEKALIEKAYHFAEKAHAGQKRNSGEPYFNHVVATAKILAHLGMDTKTIVAGLLHDTIEDTEVTEEILEKEFGSEILTLVNGVTKLGTMKYRGAERHVESLRKFFMAIANDLRVLIIKLADRLHNVRTLEHVPPEKQKRIALETIEIHAKLANRIGMGKLKGYLEDASFQYAYPKEYAETNELLEDRAQSHKKDLAEVSTQLTKELEKHKVKVLEMSQRLKNKYSLWQKLKRYNMDIDRIYDLIALRVIVRNEADCYRVLGIIHSVWHPLEGRIKDYIATPKPNGYRSLHTTIYTGNNGSIAEIQIRTSEMHAEAAYGIAAHFVYKERKSKKHPFENIQNLNWIEQLKDLQKLNDKPKQFLEHLKTDLFHDRIFIFTPKGDVVDLPEGSTPIDFAYAIHSDIGDHAHSAKINGKIGTLFTKLKNHDMVEIKSQKNSNPSSKWLDNTKTSMAKKHINQYLNKNSLLQKFKSFAKF